MLVAAIAPSAEPELIGGQGVFRIKKHLSKEPSWVVVVSKELCHWTAGSANTTFKAIFEFFSVQKLSKNLFGVHGWGGGQALGPL